MAVGRLLVVDDDPEFGELVRKLGVKLGFEVEVTSDGEAFMRRYDSFQPSVVMLDMIMPDIEGFELIEWLGERGADAHVIVVTGYGMVASFLLGHSLLLDSRSRVPEEDRHSSTATGRDVSRHFPDQVSPQETHRHYSGEHTRFGPPEPFFSIATPLERGTDHK